MRVFTRRWAALVLALVVGSQAPASGSDSSCWQYKRSERRFASKTNSARSNSGRRNLTLDPELSKVARSHTRAMAESGTLYHSPRRQLRRRVTHWVSLGENVGYGGSVKSIQRAFMKSDSHRANILARAFRYVGVGVRRANGRMWVTVIFEARNNPGTTLRMPC